MNNVKKLLPQKRIAVRNVRTKTVIRKNTRSHPAKKGAARGRITSTKAHARVNEKQAKTQSVNKVLLSRIATAEEIERVIKDNNFSNYVVKNSGKKSIDVIKALVTPQTDEDIAAKSGIKINEVRRILNDFNKFGFARYNTHKDGKGWLTFVWYVDGDKLNEFTNTIHAPTEELGFKLQEMCDDFFICEKCYKEQKTILPFDAAAEANFRCDVCGKMLTRISRESAERLISASRESE
ncbi:MAG: hypothetical protein QXZ38_02875 [Candidatus Micrarchaeaceae archaeon]